MHNHNPRKGAKAVTWSYDELQSFDDTMQRCYALTDRQVAALLTVTVQQMTWPTRWFNAPDGHAEDFSAEITHAFMASLPCNDTEKANTQFSEYIAALQTGDIEMGCRHSIEDISGRTYLTVDCGCGNIRRFALSEASIDPITGGTIQPEEIADIPIVDSDNANCYQTRATNYLLDRAAAYAGQVYDLLSFGVDIAIDWDEYVDGAGTVVDVLNGGNDVDELSQYTKSQMVSALQGETFRADMASRLPIGKLSRLSLLQWTNSAPWLVGGIPVKIILNLWVSNTLLFGYQSALSQIATDCNSSFEPQINTYTPSSGISYYEFTAVDVQGFVEIPEVLRGSNFLGAMVINKNLFDSFNLNFHYAKSDETNINGTSPYNPGGASDHIAIGTYTDNGLYSGDISSRGSDVVASYGLTGTFNRWSDYIVPTSEAYYVRSYLEAPVDVVMWSLAT